MQVVEMQPQDSPPLFKWLPKFLRESKIKVVKGIIYARLVVMVRDVFVALSYRKAEVDEALFKKDVELWCQAELEDVACGGAIADWSGASPSSLACTELQTGGSGSGSGIRGCFGLRKLSVAN
jgi:hypothetical protein